MLERLAEDRAVLRKQTVGRALGECDERFPDRIHEVIGDVLYHERKRLEQEAGPDAEEDLQFYRRSARRAAGASSAVQRRVLVDLVNHYLNGIIGNFDPWVYGLATRVLPAGLSLLADGISPLNILRLRERAHRLDDILCVTGEVDAVRGLKAGGASLVYVPSHSSNLDSAIIAYALYRAGLPAALYGAGQTVFELPVFGAFMNQLGAYRIDRAHRSDLYRMALKAFATSSLVKGYDNLFFPGGERSRSGAVETRLKKGLLGTALAASQWNMETNHPRPWVYVVPMAVTWELVLEAETLVADHLLRTGRSKVIIPGDDSFRPERIMGYMRRMFGLDTRIVVRFMPPLDPFGHAVDCDGRTVFPGTGKVVDPMGYLQRNGVLVSDRQRDRVFTDKLAESTVRSMHQGTELYSTHLVARAAFGSMRGLHRSKDLYRFLASEGKGASLSRIGLVRKVGKLKKAAESLAAAGGIQLSAKVRSGRSEEIVRDALKTFGTQEGVPALEERGGRVFSRNPNLLLYYRNRLNGFGLDDEPDAPESGRNG